MGRALCRSYRTAHIDRDLSNGLEAVWTMESSNRHRSPHEGEHHPGPRGGKAAGVHIGVLQQVKVLRSAVIGVAGDAAVCGADHIAVGGGKAVPMAGAAAAKGGAFDLTGGLGGAEQEAGWQIKAG